MHSGKIEFSSYDVYGTAIESKSSFTPPSLVPVHVSKGEGMMT